MTITDTDRLTFRLMDENDKQLLFDLDQDPEVMRFINGGTPTSWEDIEQRFLPRLRAYRNPENGWGLWQINLKDNDAFLGWVLVRPMDFFSEQRKDNNLEIGWRLKQKYWGKGYATEAAKAIMETLAELPKVDKISAIADPDNQGSINIMKKLGMRYLKTYTYRDGGREEDVVYYQIDVKGMENGQTAI
ncbi:GNAT family N-acetyltransferase [Thalassotalea sp. PS06]|nr:GNAT family N-acetyltransferase [Thalassotalea sp. PS06]